MLAWKFRFGLFEDPYVDPEVAERIVGCEAHRALALQARRETITLLKNDGGLAPLDPNQIKTIAVIGPNADRQMLGGYSGVPKHYTTLLQGIRDRVGRRSAFSIMRAARSRLAGPGSRTRSRRAIRTRTARASPRRSRSHNRPMS